jgi:hypothetical protein
MGYCISPSGISTVNCSPRVESSPGFAETSSGAANDDLALQSACLVQQGTSGCGVEQQLEAVVRSLETHPDFLVDSHLLTVLVVSDEEDCSIEEPELFQTVEWRSGPSNQLNIACNYPRDNEQFLFEPRRYYDALLALKKEASRIIFAGIVGVPFDPVCQGSGADISACLDHPSMQMSPDTFKTDSEIEYTHFTPACVRMEGEREVTVARPGRRFVEVARLFGANGYISSICNPEWTTTSERIAALIGEGMSNSCPDEQIDP